MSVAFQRDFRFKRVKDAAFRVIDSEAVIVDTRGGLVNVVNESGTLIWELCDGSNTFADIISRILIEFEVEQAVAEADAEDFFKELLGQGLIEVVAA